MDLILAAIGGAVFFGLLLAATHRTYRQTLLSIADAESCEKLPDGNFYYLVREDYYNKLLAFERAARAQPDAGVLEDAARYRWLREQPYATWENIAWNTCDDAPTVWPYRDAAIDAARAQ